MGIIKAIGGAFGGTLADSYKEVISCPAMNNSIMACPGTKLRNNSERNQNRNGESNTISNGSAILVEESTVMLTIDNGKITNVVAEPGQYILDNSSSPALLAGQISDSFKEFFRRTAFGGVPSTEQRVIYINMQKLPAIQFGTATPMPYFDPRYNTTIDLRMHGKFEVQIPDAENAVRFYQEILAKGSSASTKVITVDDVFGNAQYKDEFLQHLMVALNELSNSGCSYGQIGSKLNELCANARQASANTWLSRGLVLQSISLGPVTISDESKELLGDRLKADTMLGADVQRAMMVGSVARATEAAASNEAGAMMGFMGMNMAQMAGGNILGTMPAATMQQTPPPVQPQQNGWVCTCGATATGAFCSGCGSKKPEPKPAAETWKCSCGADNTGKFCCECGKGKEGTPPAPPASWVCSCGQENKNKFCSNCGTKKPEAPKKFKCDKCGFIPEDPTKPPKFCPECGDPFNDDDAE